MRADGGFRQRPDHQRGLLGVHMVGIGEVREIFRNIARGVVPAAMHVGLAIALGPDERNRLVRFGVLLVGALRAEIAQKRRGETRGVEPLGNFEHFRDDRGAGDVEGLDHEAPAAGERGEAEHLIGLAAPVGHRLGLFGPGLEHHLAALAPDARMLERRSAAEAEHCGFRPRRFITDVIDGDGAAGKQLGKLVVQLLFLFKDYGSAPRVRAPELWVPAWSGRKYRWRAGSAARTGIPCSPASTSEYRARAVGRAA